MNHYLSWLTLVIAMVLAMVIAPSRRVAASSSRTSTLHYSTTYQGKTYHKQALVYLPAGYSFYHRYNTIYLLHGSTETPREFYEDGRFEERLDSLIHNHQLTPSIVVFPTYYPSRNFVSQDYYRDRRLNRAFAQHELVSDLLPAVARHYSTYAHNSSSQALAASRNHRAFGGFSMGSITTWYVFQYQLPYFHDFLPIAGDAWNVESDGGSSAPRKTAQLLSRAVVHHHEPQFRIFAAVGSADGTQSSMSPQIRAMRKLKTFNNNNLSYYRVPGGSHSPATVARAFEHYAPSIFN